MSTPDIQALLGDTIIKFASSGAFPEEETISAAYIKDSALPPALKGLSNAKASLETEIRNLSHDNAADIDTWIRHAQGLQDDIDKSRRLASEIVRQAEADEARTEAFHEQELYISFLEKETAFNDQLKDALHALRESDQHLRNAEEFARSKSFHEALRALDRFKTRVAGVQVGKTTRAMRLLDTRCSELDTYIHEELQNVWKTLVNVDTTKRQLVVNKEIPDKATTLDHAIIGLGLYQEVETLAKSTWMDLDYVIIQPRLDLKASALHSIRVEGNTLSIGEGQVDNTIISLFNDLELIIRFLVKNLPPDFVRPLSEVMMPSLAARIKESWLNTAVPASLEKMDDYQRALELVEDFAAKLESLQWPGVDDFHDWVTNAPKIWLGKKREESLEWTRNQLSLGIGLPQTAERKEVRLVTLDENAYTTSVINLKNQDWDDAWDSNEDEDDGGKGEKIAKENELNAIRNRASVEEERRMSMISPPSPGFAISSNQEDEEIEDAWGWGDDDNLDIETPFESINPSSTNERLTGASEKPSVPQEVTLTETCQISSMPQPVFNTIKGILDDAARLTYPENETVPVVPAAAGLFSLPTLTLAMYRAVSPYYYNLNPNGNMYLYNDAVWLSNELKSYASQWKQRDDLSPRTYGMVKLEPEIKSLESFAKRGYTNELNTQRTILTDFLGGTQNFLQQDGLNPGDLEDGIQGVVDYINRQSKVWKTILPYSAWASATGTIINTVASKIIDDIFDLSDLGVDEAERTARLISMVTELDALFTDETSTIPMTSRFVEKWMKLKFLSEVLQSNLKDIKYFWFESDLSVYFTPDEIIDLINLSFENNTTVRQMIREIKESPLPVRGY